MFKVGSACMFDIGKECVIIRRDVHEVIQTFENVQIILNTCEIKGYTVINRETIEIEGQRYYKDEVKEKIKEVVKIK